MKRKILAILAILLGLAGLGVLLYPSVSNWMEQAKQRRQIAAYQDCLLYTSKQIELQLIGVIILMINIFSLRA